MNRERLKRAEEIFGLLLEAPPDRRAERIAELCAGDAALAQEVRSLLGCAGEDDGFLDHAEIRALGATLAGPPAARTRRSDGAELPAATRIGDFTLIRPLGAGGMGRVYIAEQDRPRRTVALKLVHRGLASPALLRRFEHEAEVLGRLQHPGIAQIFEAGSAEVDGAPQPYIAMELIDGRSLTEHAQRLDLDSQARVRLIAEVCDAVHHAHQRGIIHRDLKPGNILVDQSGHPKVLDFGVARISSADAHLTTMSTGVGQLIGTLAYMSPEQITGDPGAVDVRSDVYALGVLLYELLAGRLPHDLGGKALPEAARAIREDPPERLSHLSRVFRGELDTIVSKALEKDPARRYQSAADLGDDLRRYLAGEPIAARRDSAMYVLRKRLKRYRWAVAAAAAFMIGLVTFAVHAGLSARRERLLARAADEARRTAIVDRDQANKARDRYRTELALANIERGRLEAEIGNLPLAEDLLWRAYFDEPDSLAARWGLWALHHRAPPLWTVQPGGNSPAAEVSADGRLAVLGLSSGEIVTIDGRDGRVLSKQRGPGGAVQSVALSPDGAFALVGTATGRSAVAFLDGRPLRPLAAAGGRVRIGAAAVSPDGSLLATGGSDGLVRIFDAASREMITAWPAHKGDVTSMRFSPDGALLAAGVRAATRDDVFLRIFRPLSGVLESEYAGARDSAAIGVTFSPDGREVMVAVGPNAYRVDLSTGTVSEIPAGTNRPLGAFAFSPEGDRLGALGRFGITVFDRDATEPQRIVASTRGMPASIAWRSHDVVLCVTTNGVARAVDLRPEPGLTRVGGYSSWCFGVDFSPDGRRLAIGAAAELEIVDPRSPGHRVSVPMPGPAVRTRAVRFGRDGATLFAGSSDATVRVIDAATGEIRRAVRVGREEIYSLCVDKAEERMVVGQAGGFIRVVDLRTNSVSGEWMRHPHRVTSLIWTPDEQTVAATGLTRMIRLFDARKPQSNMTLDVSADPWAMAISPEGTTLIMGTHSGSIEVIDVGTCSFRRSFPAHSRLIPGAAFSADGKLLATGSEDGLLKLWDTATWHAVLTLEPRGGEIVGVAFDPSGRFVAAATAFNFVALYDLAAVDACVAANDEYQRKRLGVPADDAAEDNK